MRCLTCSEETNSTRKKFCGDNAIKGTCAYNRSRLTTRLYYATKRAEELAGVVKEPKKVREEGSRPAIGEIGHHWRDDACGSGMF